MQVSSAQLPLAHSFLLSWEELLTSKEGRTDLEGCHLRQHTAFLMLGLQGVYTSAYCLDAQ